MFLPGIRGIIFNRGKNKTAWITYEIDAEMVERLKGIYKYRLKAAIVSDAINAWLSNKLDIDNQNLRGTHKKQSSVKINASLKEKFNEKCEKERNGEKKITLGKVIAAYITKEWGIMRLLNERQRDTDRFRRKNLIARNR